MKNRVKRFIRICVMIWCFLLILATSVDAIKYLSGGYIKVDATITYVNHFLGRSGNGSTYERANGDITWEHDGVVFESEERVGLPTDAEEGDTKEIWIDAKTGEYASMQGLGYLLFCCVSNILLCVLILKFVKIKKE